MSIFLAGMWFSACKTTPAPSTPVPPQPENSQTEDSAQSTSSAQAEKQEESRTSQTTSSEATAAEMPQSKQQSQDRQTVAKGSAGAQPPETAQQAPQSRKTTTQTADAKLAKARDDLRLSQATEKRIAEEFEQLKKSGNASDEDIRDYEAYLESVRAMVAENRKTVEKMEGAYRQHSPNKKTSNAAESGELGKLSDQTIPEEQTQDRVTELDRQLSASLAEFDTMLLKEMETIETESAAKMRDLAQEAAEAASRLKEKGVELDGDESKSSDDASQQGEDDRQSKAGQKDATHEEKGSEREKGEVDDAVASKDETKDQGSGSRDDPGSRYNKEDDDIVARQLREAAENETDPELKKKLWKEYEEYRKNTQ